MPIAEISSIVSLLGLTLVVLGFLLIAAPLLKGRRSDLFVSTRSHRDLLAIWLILGGFVVQFLGEALELIAGR